MKTVVVTGGAGFIGSHIADAYADRGWHVVVIDNLTTGDRGNVNPSPSATISAARSMSAPASRRRSTSCTTRWRDSPARPPERSTLLRKQGSRCAAFSTARSCGKRAAATHSGPGAASEARRRSGPVDAAASCVDGKQDGGGMAAPTGHGRGPPQDCPVVSRWTASGPLMP